MREVLINKGILESAIKSLAPFMSKEETRYYLCGIFFEYENGNDYAHMTATDGHKLCTIKVLVDPATDLEGNIGAIIPASALKTMLQMLRSVGNKEFPIGLGFNETNLKVHINCDEQKAEMKCIDGTFPDYRKAIPTDKPNFTIGLAKEQAREAVKAISAHRAKEPMQWHMLDASSPLKLVGDNKIVVVMPTRQEFDEQQVLGAA